jgi:hypothetical protein
MIATMHIVICLRLYVREYTHTHTPFSLSQTRTHTHTHYGYSTIPYSRPFIVEIGDGFRLCELCAFDLMSERYVTLLVEKALGRCIIHAWKL